MKQLEEELMLCYEPQQEHPDCWNAGIPPVWLRRRRAPEVIRLPETMLRDGRYYRRYFDGQDMYLYRVTFRDGSYYWLLFRKMIATGEQVQVLAIEQLPTEDSFYGENPWAWMCATLEDADEIARRKSSDRFFYYLGLDDVLRDEWAAEHDDRSVNVTERDS